MKIAEMRKSSGFTQETLAKKMNVDQSTVSLWESGKSKPQRKLHKKLAKLLGCTVDELLKEE